MRRDWYMALYSLKMRAEKFLNIQEKNGKNTEHISGAEKILTEDELPGQMATLLQRALHHGKGKADFVNLKIEALAEKDIKYIDSLPISTCQTNSPAEGRQVMLEVMEQLDIPRERGEKILSLFRQTYNMRGAMLLDADTLERLEPDQARGVRATYMDAARESAPHTPRPETFPTEKLFMKPCKHDSAIPVNVASSCQNAGKNHFREALVLATKVLSAPNIIGELCISDDPDYTTGYIATAQTGYLRLPMVKELGCPDGGRIFLYRGSHDQVAACIDYLQKQRVLVRHLPENPAVNTSHLNEEITSAEKPNPIPSQVTLTALLHTGSNATDSKPTTPLGSTETDSKPAVTPSSAEIDSMPAVPLSSAKIDSSHVSLLANDPWAIYRQILQDKKQQQLYRQTKELASAQASHVVYNGKEHLMLASNDYLGLIDHPAVKQASKEAIDLYGTGSGGSRLTTGTLPLHNALERDLAVFKGTEAALLFNTGYMANVGIISALATKDTIIFSDELNHASIIDGCRLSKAKIVIYKHCGMADLEAKLQEHAGKHGLIVSDAVFSMDGDIAPLPELLALGKKYHVLTMVDEAHSTGVIGRTGRGIVEHFYPENYVMPDISLSRNHKPDILMGTLSKALAAEGGYVCGSQLLIDYLRNTARSYIFSTSLSPAVLAAAQASLHLLQQEPAMAQRLQANIRIFCQALQSHGIQADSETAIIPIRIGDEALALQAAQALAQQGIFLTAIRYPTVPRGQALLRVALMATHTPKELTEAAATIAECLQTIRS